MKSLVHFVDVRLTAHTWRQLKDLRIPYDKLISTFSWLIKDGRYSVMILLKCNDVNEIYSSDYN